jgi:hypothetical protein
MLFVASFVPATASADTAIAAEDGEVSSIRARFTSPDGQLNSTLELNFQAPIPEKQAAT